MSLRQIILRIVIVFLAALCWARPVWAASENSGYRVTGNDDLSVIVNARGDLDGDDLPDVAVGVPEENGAELGAGAVYVFLGKNVGTNGVLELMRADYVIEGGYEGSGTGANVSFLFDEDGDSFDELTIGFADGSSELTVFSSELDEFAALKTSTRPLLYGSTTVGVSVGVARNMDCSLNARAAHATSSWPVAAFSSALLMGLFLAKRATLRR